MVQQKQLCRKCCNDARYVPAHARALISPTYEHALAKSGIRDLYSCATPVVPELGGEGKPKPLAQIVNGPVSIIPLTIQSDTTVVLPLATS
jgi:hypothetical protein